MSNTEYIPIAALNQYAYCPHRCSRIQMEKFFQRLLLEEPDLEYLFGEAIDSMADFFYELFDCCVHQLQPETQNIVGEPLMGVPPERDHGFKTVEEY